MASINYNTLTVALTLTMMFATASFKLFSSLV